MKNILRFVLVFAPLFTTINAAEPEIVLKALTTLTNTNLSIEDQIFPFPQTIVPYVEVKVSYLANDGRELGPPHGSEFIRNKAGKFILPLFDWSNPEINEGETEVLCMELDSSKFLLGTVSVTDNFEVKVSYWIEDNTWKYWVWPLLWFFPRERITMPINATFVSYLKSEDKAQAIIIKTRSGRQTIW